MKLLRSHERSIQQDRHFAIRFVLTSIRPAFHKQSIIRALCQRNETLSEIPQAN